MSHQVPQQARSSKSLFNPGAKGLPELRGGMSRKSLFNPGAKGLPELRGGMSRKSLFVHPPK